MKYRVEIHREDLGWRPIPFTTSNVLAYCHGWVDCMDSMYPSDPVRIVNVETGEVKEATKGRGTPTTKNENITWTQSGQPRPYADSIYAGTVKADSEQHARDQLMSASGSTTPIFDKQDKKKWSWPYFTEFREVEPGVWKFSYTCEFTD